MGTKEEAERDWVDVANELLSKCHQNHLSLRKLADCDANVFIALYEGILGEKVPDYITDPHSQEDDIHNVQSVIDSLSLDYLQISLSHIIGENVVRGHKESIKNLLEIFDGLLEYLNEDTSEESQNSESNNSPNEDLQSEEKERASVSSSAESGAQSCNQSPSSLNEVPMNCNVIELRDSDDIQTLEESSPVCPPVYSQSEAIPSVVEPQSQSDAPHPDFTSLHTSTADPNTAQLPESTSDRRSDSPLQVHSPVLSDRFSSHQKSNNTDLDKEALELTHGGSRKVLFRTQPDVLFLTVQNESGATDSEDNLGTTYHRQIQSRQTAYREREEDVEPLSSRRQRNKRTEEELHNISENLSHRLEELDQMLKRVLCEPGEPSEVRSVNDHSREETKEQRWTQQHSDLHDPAHSQASQRSPKEPEGKLFFVEDGRQSNLTTSDQSKCSKPTYRLSQRKLCKYLLDKVYQEELERYEDKEKVELDRVRLRALDAEREYREAILKNTARVPEQTRKKSQLRSHRKTAPPVERRQKDTPRKPPKLKVKNNDLLPVLAEELPHLHISSRVLRQMWQEQMQQVDRLHAMSTSRGQRHSKLSQQLEEARRKHSLLTEINRKEQDHSRRLREFKERIQQQKSTQSKLREQRQQIARAKKYHNEFHVQHRARLMRARTEEERMFRQLFEDGLSIQKHCLIEQRAYAREERLENQKRQAKFMQSMENYYKDQFSLLAEKLAQERQDIQVRKKAQEKALLKMKQELRSRMEREIQDLQRIIIENDEDEYFQGLDVQRLRNRLHLASFSHNTSYLP